MTIDHKIRAPLSRELGIFTGKIVFVVFGIVCLLVVLTLRGGTYAYNEEECLQKCKRAIDFLAEKRLDALSTETMKVTISPFSYFYGGTLFLPHDITVYSTAKRTNIQEVEKEFLETFSRVLTTYNDIPEMRPYLACFPMLPKEFELSIKYGPHPKTYYALPYYCSAIHRLSDNTVRVSRLEKPGGKFVTQPGVKNSLWDFPQLVEFTKVGVPRSKEREVSPIIIDKETRGAGYAPSAYLAILRDLYLKHDLHRAAFCDIPLERYRDHKISIAPVFWAQNKEMKLEEARVFSEEFIEDFLGQLRRRRIVEKWWKNEQFILKDLKETLDWFSFRISLWDKWLNRVEEPYIALIQCQDGKITYFTADEGQRLQKVLEEPVPARFFPQAKQ